MSLYQVDGAAREAFRSGITAGVKRAGGTADKGAAKAAVASFASEIDEKYWDVLKEFDPPPSTTEAKELGSAITEHKLNQFQGKNTDQRIAAITDASWRDQRAKRNSARSTDADFAAARKWMEKYHPKANELLVGKLGHVPDVVRFIMSRFDEFKATKPGSTWMRSARNKNAVAGVRPGTQLLAGAGREGAVALAQLGKRPLDSDAA
jgi:hypothetical protein